MARPRKDGNTNIEEQITKQEEQVAKSKAMHMSQYLSMKMFDYGSDNAKPDR